MKKYLGIGATLVGIAIGVSMVSATDPTTPATNQSLPKPDGKPADMTKPVQVFILLGQSNMVGLGKMKGSETSMEHAGRAKKK